MLQNKQTKKGRFAELRELRTLLPYLRKYRKQVFAGIVFIILTNAFTLLAPQVLRYAIDMLDKLGKNITKSSLLQAGGLILLVSLLGGICRYWMRQLIIVVSRLIEYDLRNDYFRHLQTLSRNFFHRVPTGDLMARATNDLGSVRSLLGPGIMYSTNTFTVGVGALAIMLWMNAQLTLAAMLLLPIMVITVNYAMDRIHKLYEKIQEQFSRLTTRAQENLSGIRVIKAYQRESYEIGAFANLNRDYLRRNLSLAKLEGVLWSMMGLLSGASTLILLWLGGRSVMQGDFTKGQFVAFFAYMGELTWPMIALGWVINLMQQGTASMGRLNRILHETPDIKDDAATDTAITTIRGEIEFQNVGVFYPGRDWVLRHIDLKIPAGATLAIVGHTGSGKSTLVNLIPRLIEPTEGKILIDGVESKRIPLEVLRRHLGCVPQETFLFSDTIRENMIFGLDPENGAPEKNRFADKILAAAEVAQIRKEIESFPEKFETMLGERGINLSGGQKQRTAIARAVIRQPRILILDDALSSVDTYTEEEILRGLREVMRQRTSIIISHRVSTVKNADMIIVLADGRIVETGNHETLLLNEGPYAQLHRQQQLEEAFALLD